MIPPPASPEASDPARRMEQCADAVMMIRPASFGWNAETAGSNRFQSRGAVPGRLASDLARVEFDALADALRHAGVVVHAFEDRAEPICPDAVFPNNWVSFHADGTAVLYPLLAPSRRLERRPELLHQLVDRNAFELRRTVDLTHFEDRSEYLEGTGSLVLDRVGRIAYACLSPRTHRGPLDAFCARLGYEPYAFEATDAEGIPVYHTNVVLSLGSALAIVAIDNVVAADRERLLSRLSAGGRHVECIDTRQTANFAANALELRDVAAASVLAMSSRAWESFLPDARARLANCVDRRVIVPIPTIEALGGGSVRCMLAEVFNPREEAG